MTPPANNQTSAPTPPTAGISTPSTPTPPSGNQVPAPTQNTSSGHTLTVGKVNYTSKQLFEVSGAVDMHKDFPEAIAFVMFIPGVPDNTKATGITYNQSAKEIMKINVRDLFALAEALTMAAHGAQTDFIVYTDSSKSFANTTGVGITKQVSVGSGEWKGNTRVYLNYKGQGQIQLSMDRWHALGLANQIKTLAQETLNHKFKEERRKYGN